MNSLLPLPYIDQMLLEALREDWGRRGDITSLAIIDETKGAKAALMARKAGCLSGMQLAQRSFELCASNIEFHPLAQDGEKIAAGQMIATLNGPARALLAGERVALNYLSHLSGIASLTAHYVEHAANDRVAITCTRKTTPGLRLLEKYAVRCGGGTNHRFGLDDAILIKDNHIALAGDISTAMARARAFAGHLTAIEIEVDTLDQLRQALRERPHVIMLDNMSISELRKAVEIVGGEIPLEASGNVTLENIAAIAQTGVDIISCGALTHSAPALDIGLDVIQS